MSPALPIAAALPDIRAALARANRLVLAAPPGAGKTTAVPLDLLSPDSAPWRSPAARLILLEPRRIAARMAAERMAALLGERVGATIGLRTRLDTRVSAATRLEIVTEGVFTRMILSDPTLDGVAAVIFDEFHERALSADLGLTLALETQSAFRPDLRLILMSATLDTQRLALALSAQTVTSEGRAFPVTTRHLGRDRDERVEDAMARALARALRETDGSILAFLPGQAEILRTRERLEALSLPPSVEIAPLYGALPPAEQDAAVRPPAPASRKIILATDIAESSLTIEGVSVVVDAGLARVPEVDPATGLSRLVTRRAPRSSIDQRRGRAGRTGPGVCYRLWDEAEERGLPASAEPEILGADLSGLVLDLAAFGEADPLRLTWIDPPPAGRLRAAQSLLTEIGALTPQGALTPIGTRLADLPLPPRLGLLIALAETQAEAALGAQLCVLLSERGAGGPSTDALERLRRLRKGEGRDARALDLARRWSPGTAATEAASADNATLANLLLRAWPQRLARARDRVDAPGTYLLASGEAAKLEAHDPLSKSEWLAILDMTGAAREARITLALAVPEPLALARVETAEITGFSPESGALWARRVRRIGAITLSETPLPPPRGPAAAAALAQAVRTHGITLLPGHEAVAETLARLALVRTANSPGAPSGDWPALTGEDLTEALIRAVAEAGQARLDAFDTGRVRAALMALLPWPLPRELDRLAPLTWQAPTGTQHRIDHTGEHAPRVSLRVQEVYGQAAHPALAEGRVPLTLELLSPAHRPVALTRDLPGFWRGGYTDMRKDMRGRYPKHDWPEDPWNTQAHTGKVRRKG